MSTAHKPTWNPRRAAGDAQKAGVLAPPTFKTSVKDQPGHIKLRVRLPEQLSAKTSDEIEDQELLQLAQIPHDNQEARSGEAAHSENNSSGDEGSNSDDDESTGKADDDEEEELVQREFERIKAERAVEVERMRRQIDQHSATARSSPSWLDDAPFHLNHQHPVLKDGRKQFINDATRSDFHKQFMGKFIG